MLEKLLDQTLQRAHIQHGRLNLTYWDGVTRTYGTGGPEVNVTITNPAVVRHMLVNASIGLSEGYMNGEVDIDEDQLTAFFTLIVKNMRVGGWLRQPDFRAPNIKGLQQRHIQHHYDVGNEDYYFLWLDEVTRAYTCAYFQSQEDSLEQAQQQKIDRVLRKLRLQPGQSLLDLGCGWGHLAVTAAKKYDVNVLAVTLSEEQVTAARDLAEREDMASRVTFRRMNYQDLNGDDGQFDAVVSVGMLEHVGRGNLARYFDVVKRMLAPGGISLVHCITQTTDRRIDPFVAKHVFPGGHLHRVSAIEREIERRGFYSVHREDLWQHYALTLEHWRERHRAHREEIIQRYGEVFYRMRDFWLAGCIVAFRHFDLGLNQILFTNGKPQEWPLTYDWMSA